MPKSARVRFETTLVVRERVTKGWPADDARIKRMHFSSRERRESARKRRNSMTPLGVQAPSRTVCVIRSDFKAMLNLSDGNIQFDHAHDWCDGRRVRSLSAAKCTGEHVQILREYACILCRRRGEQGAPSLCDSPPQSLRVQATALAGVATHTLAHAPVPASHPPSPPAVRARVAARAADETQARVAALGELVQQIRAGPVDMRQVLAASANQAVALSKLLADSSTTAASLPSHSPPLSSYRPRPPQSLLPPRASSPPQVSWLASLPPPPPPQVSNQAASPEVTSPPRTTSSPAASSPARLPMKSPAGPNRTAADEFLDARVRAWDRRFSDPSAAVELVATYAGQWRTSAGCKAPRLWVLLSGHYRTFHWTQGGIADMAALSSGGCYMVAAAVPEDICTRATGPAAASSKGETKCERPKWYAKYPWQSLDWRVFAQVGDG